MALYLIAVLVGITLLVLMNVGLCLAVTAKNRAMNAGDAAAIAVAKHQGELLNRIGKLNIEHLEAAMDGDLVRCGEIMREQARICFLGPLDGITLGNDAAAANGAETSDDMLDILKQHVIDIRTVYEPNPTSYPEPWEGAWEEYAKALELAIGGGLFAGPDNIDFMDAAGGHLLLNKSFYEAIRGQCWCWFHFNAPGLLDSYASFNSWAPLPSSDDETRRRKCVNSEVYSLELEARTGSALALIGKDRIARLTGKSPDDVIKCELLHDETQVWYFYDSQQWRRWWEIDPAGEWAFPVVGSVRPEYDVRGCAACCRIVMDIPNVVGSGGDRETSWTGAAKPFGTVADENGDTAAVTALGNLVTSAFADTRLVPWDAVGGRDLSTADADWMHHIQEHLPLYLQSGPDERSSCDYCQTLVLWERSELRERARNWLRDNSKTCVRSSPGGIWRGGTPHGH